jgi:hypothetical protein
VRRQALGADLSHAIAAVRNADPVFIAEELAHNWSSAFLVNWMFHTIEALANLRPEPWTTAVCHASSIAVPTT